MSIILTRKDTPIEVDASDFTELSSFKWHLDRDGYAVRGKIIAYPDGRKGVIKIHMARQVLGLVAGDGLIADHIDGNVLNNRRSNLRVVTRAQNSMNRGKYAKSTSKYKGVSWNARCKKWQVCCKGSYLGVFVSETQAAKAYIDKAKKVFGNFYRELI